MNQYDKYLITSYSTLKDRHVNWIWRWQCSHCPFQYQYMTTNWPWWKDTGCYILEDNLDSEISTPMSTVQ